MYLEPTTQSKMPALALRGLTIFPNMMLHFDVARAASIKALDEAMTGGTPIFLVTQKDLMVEEPKQADLYTVGTVCNVRQILRLPGDNVRVMVDGICPRPHGRVDTDRTLPDGLRGRNPRA